MECLAVESRRAIDEEVRSIPFFEEEEGIVLTLADEVSLSELC